MLITLCAMPDLLDRPLQVGERVEAVGYVSAHGGLAEASGWLERSSIGAAVRMTPLLYPMLESLHILGIALLVGPVLAVDLRLLGVGRGVLPVTIVSRYLLPISHTGFGLVALTDAAMFPGIALAVTSSPAAPWKFGLMVISGLNIVIFHRGVYRTVQDWDLMAAHRHGHSWRRWSRHHRGRA